MNDLIAKKNGYAALKLGLGKVGLSPLSLAGFIILFLAPFYITNNYLLRVLVSAVYFGTLGMGFDLSVGYIGVANWGYAGLTGLGAYVSALLLVNFGVSPAIGIPVAAIVSGLMGMLIGLLTLRMNPVE